MNALLHAQRILVGRQIRKARQLSGLSHDKLAARIGTSRQHLIKLENGQHLPRPEMLAAIARETGKSERFFDSDDDEESDPVADLMSAIRRLVTDEVSRVALVEARSSNPPPQLTGQASDVRVWDGGRASTNAKGAA